LSSPPSHEANFVRNRTLGEINQQPQRATPKMLPLRWLGWSGALSLLLAMGLIALVLPQQFERRSAADFNSQVIFARGNSPDLSVSEFQAPDHRGVVIWIEGADYIPAEAKIK
jgi:hypothetical protein